MDKIWIATIGIIVLIPIIAFIIFFSYNASLSPSLSSTNLEKCNSLIYNAQAKTSLVFFSSKENAEKYANFFLQTKPFSDNKNNFNFNYIDSYNPKCEIYQGIATLCYSKEIIKKASSCPNDYIVVLDTQESKIRSSTYMNVLSLNSASQLSILTHEFGHAFANLADEYVPAELSSGSKNCVLDCKDFLNKSDGCFQGCSKTEYFRSIDSGVMRTLSSNNYGLFNEDLISGRIFKSLINPLTGFAVENQENLIDCSSQKYYLIEAVYNDGTIEVKDKTIESGCPGSNGYGGFNYSIIKSDGSIVTENEFNPELIFTDVQLEEELQGEIIISGKSFLLKVPIIKDSKELQISKDAQILSQINLQDIGARPCRGG